MAPMGTANKGEDSSILGTNDMFGDHKNHNEKPRQGGHLREFVAPDFASYDQCVSHWYPLPTNVGLKYSLWIQVAA